MQAGHVRRFCETLESRGRVLLCQVRPWGSEVCAASFLFLPSRPQGLSILSTGLLQKAGSGIRICPSAFGLSPGPQVGRGQSSTSERPCDMSVSHGAHRLPEWQPHRDRDSCWQGEPFQGLQCLREALQGGLVGSPSKPRPGGF